MITPDSFVLPVMGWIDAYSDLPSDGGYEVSAEGGWRAACPRMS